MHTYEDISDISIEECQSRCESKVPTCRAFTHITFPSLHCVLHSLLWGHSEQYDLAVNVYANFYYYCSKYSVMIINMRLTYPNWLNEDTSVKRTIKLCVSAYDTTGPLQQSQPQRTH